MAHKLQIMGIQAALFLHSTEGFSASLCSIPDVVVNGVPLKFAYDMRGLPARWHPAALSQPTWNLPAGVKTYSPVIGSRWSKFKMETSGEACRAQVSSPARVHQRKEVSCRLNGMLMPYTFKFASLQVIREIDFEVQKAFEADRYFTRKPLSVLNNEAAALQKTGKLVEAVAAYSKLFQKVKTRNIIHAELYTCYNNRAAAYLKVGAVA